MNIHEKLLAVQVELKAPKGQYNSFGKYKYRSCEDILTAVKPLLDKVKATITVTDDVVYIGNRFYIKATASFVDVEKGASVENTAFAREDETKKGMDGSQITGTASSYARKYALNGLLLIDDTKDADTDENRNERDNRAAKKEEDRTGKPAYPTMDDMVEDVEKYLEKDVKMREWVASAMKQSGCDSIGAMGEKQPNFIKACWNKWCNK